MQKLKGALCTMAQSAQQDQDTKAPPRRRPVSRLAVAVYTLCWSVLLCFGLLVAIMQDRTLPVPELLRVKLSQVLNANRTLPFFLLLFSFLSFFSEFLGPAFFACFFRGFQLGLWHLLHEPSLADREDVLSGPIKGEGGCEVVTEKEENKRH